MENSKNKLFSIIFLFTLMAILFPSLANADIPASLKTYTVYNEFNATVNAFQRLGLMMSDPSYKGLFFSVVVIGIVIGGIATIGRGILFGKSSAMAWVSLFGMLFAGVITYSAFVKNTTTITVYDEALNQQIAIGGIPDGVAFIAGLANKIETGLVDIIWASGDPRSYRENSGGIGFSILTKAFAGGADLSGTGNGGIHNNVSLRRYIKDCLYFELSRPGSTLDLNDININTDFIPLLQQASNPAIYTVWYDDANKAGVTVTCTQAWTNLNAYFSTLTNGSIPVQQFWQERCRKVLPGTTGAIGPGLTQTCEDKATGLLNNILGIAVSESQLMRQYLIASELWNVMQDTDPDTQMAALASQSTGTHLVGMGIQANDWIPIMRSTLFSIMLGTMPFLFLLVPTPIFARAVSMIFGIFVFLTSWGVCDALAHSFAMDKAYSVFDGIQNGQIGFLSMMLMKNTSCKALAAFGAARWSAMMIAGLMSSMLVRFGGSTLAHAISGFNMKGFGAAAGPMAVRPGPRQSELSALRRTVPMEAVSNQYSFASLSRAGAYKELTDVKTSLGAVDQIGHGNVQRASTETASANVMGTRKGIAQTHQIKAAANKMFGGDVDGMLNAEQAVVQGKAAGGAAQIISDGRDPLAAGGKAGQSEGIGLEATGDRLTALGGKGAYSTELSKKFNEDAKMGVRRALDDVAQTGRITPETGGILANIAGHPLGRAQLASQGIGNRVIKPGKEADNFANYFSRHGKAVTSDNLAGATVQMNMWTDTDGGLHPSLVATNKGVRVAEHNTGTKEYDLNADQARRITGKEGATAGHYAIHHDPGTGEIVGIRGEGGFTASTGNVILNHDADGADRIQVLNPENGKPVWSSARLGEETQDIGRNVYDHRDVHKTGHEDTRGIKLSGADGLVQSDDATTVNRARDFDLIQANKLGASGETGKRNAELTATSGGKYVSNVFEEKGIDMGQIATTASTDLKWSIPGWLTGLTGAKGGIGGDIKGQQMWQNRKVHNYITSGIYQDMMKAKNTAIAKGLNETQIGHAMQEAYNKDINTLTEKGFAAKPSRELSTPELDKAAANVGQEITADPADVSTEPDKQPARTNRGNNVQKQSTASQLADQIVAGDKGQANN